LIVVLFRNNPLLRQTLPAPGGDPRELKVRFALLIIGQGLLQRSLCLLYRGLGLTKLLIQFGSFNLGKRLSRPDAIANVDKASAEIAVSAGKNGGFGEGLNVSGQLKLTLAVGSPYLDYFHARESLVLL